MSKVELPIVGRALIPSVNNTALQPLSIEQCKEMLNWHHKSDTEIAEFLSGMRSWIDQFYDNYFPESN